MAVKKLFGVSEILHNSSYEAISVTVDKETTGTVSENGRKILKAGTILAGDGVSIFEDRSKKVKKVADEASATFVDGVLLYDVDLTESNAAASLVYRGTIREDKCGNGTVHAKVKELLRHIQFVKGV